MCRLWRTLHKVPRTDGCNPKTKASGEKILEKYMNGPHHFKRHLTHGIKAVETVPTERDILMLAEMAANDEKEEDEERHNINKLFRKLRKDRKEEARALLEEMQKHLEKAQARASATEQKIVGRYDEYMRTWTEDRGRPHFIMDMIWQMLQSIDTTSLNLTKDFEELWDMAQETGWLGPAKPRKLWTEEEDEE